MNKRINVAIDGPAGAGKSTVARLVAGKLGYVYIDTGAMYRAVTLAVIHRGIHPDQTDRIADLCRELQLRLEPGDHGQSVFLNEENVTESIRTTEVANMVSSVARIAEVRQQLVAQQKRLAQLGGVVMDGRDIGSKVLPDAEVKIYLTASVEERARRRFEESKDKDGTLTYEQLLLDIAKRDEMDSKREVSPLTIAEDAYVLDSTNMTINEVVDTIVDRCERRLNGVL